MLFLRRHDHLMRSSRMARSPLSWRTAASNLFLRQAHKPRTVVSPGFARRCSTAPCLPPRSRRAAAAPAALPAAAASASAAAATPLLLHAAAHMPLAMINVDFASPSLVLGTALIGCGIALLQARNMQQRVSRDADIVVAAMVSIVGSTLIFQGWRLDPLLLLCQVREAQDAPPAHCNGFGPAAGLPLRLSLRMPCVAC